MVEFEKIFLILVVLVCVFGLSIPSFAYSTIPASSCSYLTYNADGDFYTLKTELKVSSMSEQDLEYWKLFTDAYTGQSDDEYIIYYDSNCLYCLLLSPSSGSSFSNSGSASIMVYAPSGGYWCQLAFDFSSGQYLSSHFVQGPYGVDFSSRFVVLKTSFSSIPSRVGSVVDLNGKQLQITDDIGSLKPEEPDPPSSSSTGWIPPVVSDPVIPEGDEYVFYDTKILGLFLNHVRTQIVHAANVGWLIFGFILVWHVIKRVIKAFSSR